MCCFVQPHNGLGGELLDKLFARARAMKFGMLYIYTPVSRVQHVENVSSSTPLPRPLGGRPNRYAPPGATIRQ